MKTKALEVRPVVEIVAWDHILPEWVPEKYQNIRPGSQVMLQYMEDMTHDVQKSISENTTSLVHTPRIQYVLRFIRNGRKDSQDGVFDCSPRENASDFYHTLIAGLNGEYWEQQVKLEETLRKHERMLQDRTEDYDYGDLVLRMARENLSRVNAGSTQLLKIPLIEDYQEAKKNRKEIVLPKTFLRKPGTGIYELSIPQENGAWAYTCIPEAQVTKDPETGNPRVSLPDTDWFSAQLVIPGKNGKNPEVIQITTADLIRELKNGMSRYTSWIQQEAADSLETIETSYTVPEGRKENLENQIKNRLSEPVPDLIDREQKTDFFTVTNLLALLDAAGSAAVSAERESAPEPARTEGGKE